MVKYGVAAATVGKLGCAANRFSDVTRRLRDEEELWSGRYQAQPDTRYQISDTRQRQNHAHEDGHKKGHKDGVADQIKLEHGTYNG